jgi:hypothetical protein
MAGSPPPQLHYLAGWCSHCALRGTPHLIKVAVYDDPNPPSFELGLTVHLKCDCCGGESLLYAQSLLVIDSEGNQVFPQDR